MGKKIQDFAPEIGNQPFGRWKHSNNPTWSCTCFFFSIHYLMSINFMMYVYVSFYLMSVSGHMNWNTAAISLSTFFMPWLTHGSINSEYAKEIFLRLQIQCFRQVQSKWWNAKALLELCLRWFLSQPFVWGTCFLYQVEANFSANVIR